MSSEGLPLSMTIGAGNEHDSKRFIEVLGAIRIRVGRGRPLTRPEEIDADSAYDNNLLRLYLRGRGIKANIPRNKRNRKSPKRGRPVRFNDKSYKNRGAVERFFGWLKMGFRRLVVSYERLKTCLMGMLNISSFFMYWRRIYD